MKGTVFRPKDADLITHFWVVITNEVDGYYVGVNVTDEGNVPDSPCKLTPQCHDRITKPSVIYYKKALRFPAATFQKGLQSCQVFSPCSAELLDRIIAGAFNDGGTKDAILDLIKKDGHKAKSSVKQSAT